MEYKAAMDVQPPLHFRRGQPVIAFADTTRGNLPRAVCVGADENNIYGNVAYIWLAAAIFEIDAEKLYRAMTTGEKRLFAWISGHVIEEQTMQQEDEPVEIVFDPTGGVNAFKCTDSGNPVLSAEYVHFQRSYGVRFIEAYGVTFGHR